MRLAPRQRDIGYRHATGRILTLPSWSLWTEEFRQSETEPGGHRGLVALDPPEPPQTLTVEPRGSAKLRRVLCERDQNAAFAPERFPAVGNQEVVTDQQITLSPGKRDPSPH